MEASSYQVLKASFSTNEHIYFSYTKLSFQTNIYSIIVPIVVLPIMLISSSLNLYNAQRNKEDIEILFFLCTLIISIVLVILSWTLYNKGKKIDGKEYYYSQIKNLRLKEWKRNARLAFEFEDGTKHKLYVKKGENFSQFIRNLNFANVKLA